MAVRFDASSDGLSSSSPLDHNSAYTAFMWFWLVSDPGNTARILWTTNRDNADHWEWLYVQNPGSGIAFGIRAETTFTQAGVLGTTPISTGVWYSVAIVRQSTTNLQVFFAPVGGEMTSDALNNFNVGSRSAALREELGAWTTTNNNALGVPGGRLFNFKSWQMALTAAELTREAQVMRPQIFTNLHRWCPMWPGDRTTDYSGNGRNWTADGTLTDEDNPPLSWGAGHATALRDDGPDYTELLAGAITPAGAVSRRASKIFAGAASPTGTMFRRATKRPSGLIAPVGTIRRQAAKRPSGAITPTGIILRRPAKKAAGTTSPTGTLFRQAAKLADGSVSPNGETVKTTTRTLGGALDSAGALVNQATKTLAGLMAPGGSLFASRTYFQNLAGSIGPAGGLLKMATKYLAGLLDPEGEMRQTTEQQIRHTKRLIGRFIARVNLFGSLRKRDVD